MSLTPSSTPGGTVAIPDDEYTGLEDFDTSDMVMPRITIKHNGATFTDTLSGQEFSEMNAILLGLVKQRILWDDEVNEGDKPLCKSFNFSEGRPDAERFPWTESGFDKTSAPSDDTGLVLPCQACALKEWGTNPRGSTPWCTEQHTFPLLMEVNGGWSPALLTVQRTGIKPSKQYLTSFARTKTPLYTCFTKLGLSQQRKGSVNFAVPIFVKGAETDQEEWPYYAQQYRTIREFITSPPRRDDDAAESTPSTVATSAPVTDVASTPVAAPTAAPTAPAATAPAAAAGDDDELPF